MSRPTKTFRQIFREWLDLRDLNPLSAAPILGVGKSAAYEYAVGTSVPCNTRAVQFGAIMGLDPEYLREVWEADRERLHGGDSQGVA